MTHKKPVKLSSDANSGAEAKAIGTNMSALSEKSLPTSHFQARQAQWQQDNAEAISNWNAWIDEHGLWADTYRL
jgi:antitoxin CcdA